MPSLGCLGQGRQAALNSLLCLPPCRFAVGAGAGAWAGCTPSLAGRSCCSVDSCVQVSGWV